jgi:hypothetical protein
MKAPDAPLSDDSIGFHQEIEEYLGEQASNLPAAPIPVRDDTSFRDEPQTWRPKKGDKPPKDCPLTLLQVIGYCDAQDKKWQQQAKADDFKEMKCCDAYSLIANHFKHLTSLLKRVKPEASVSSNSAAIAKKAVNTLLSKIPNGAKVISTAEAVRILVPAFPDLFEGAGSLRAGRKAVGTITSRTRCISRQRAHQWKSRERLSGGRSTESNGVAFVAFHHR